MASLLALVPLTLAVPALAAAVLMAAESRLPRWLVAAVATAAAATTAALCLVLFVATRAGALVYWFGGWQPRGGQTVGVPFVVDPLAAGLAALGAVMVLAGLIFSMRYFEAVGSLFHALMLLLLVGMVGFSFAADLFDLFVFFELMGVSAYALTGYRTEGAGPLQGALSFAVVNTLAGSVAVVGIALLYGRTGALAFAAVGRGLEQGGIDGLVIVALATTFAGLLGKAGAVPFHFAHADAHAVGPTPVLVVFSGAMLPVAVLGLARLYWSVFAPALGAHPAGPRGLLLAAGTLTAVVAAVMCVTQRHLKRLLAFSSLSHVGLFLVGLGLLEPEALAGTGAYVVGHALSKGALFLVVGVLLHRYESIDELELTGRGRELPLVGVLFGLAALALVGVPPFASAVGKSMVEEAAKRTGEPWVSPLFMVVSALTGGAILRAGGRVFLGWGPPREELAEMASEGEEVERETEGASRTTPAVMVAPVVVLVSAAAVAGLWPGWVRILAAAAERFQASRGYAALVLHGAAAPAAAVRGAGALGWGWLPALLALAGAGALAAASLFRERVTGAWSKPVMKALVLAVAPLKTAHSGHLGDYVTWLTVGVAAVGLAAALLLR